MVKHGDAAIVNFPAVKMSKSAAYGKKSIH
jgi:hypothetical protein